MTFLNPSGSRRPYPAASRSNGGGSAEQARTGRFQVRATGHAVLAGTREEWLLSGPKCDGLSDVDLRRRSMPPPGLSLLGLVRHMAEVERTGFRRVINGEDIPLVWSPDGDFQVAYDASSSTRSQAFAAWQDEVEHARRIESQAESLDVIAYAARWDEDVSLRLVMLHVLLEYGRHNGHADFIREGIDGATGA
jgi:Protein of unknown function (DUF664)